ncbi:hypothetical protein SDC9_77819 [bioreactor metagenome]|uniref:Uncharacterized protein n=1 Tax=bioreactor metagenome TaxID=1076179 RepID=A0A644YZ80_9ZZZZ
MIRKSGICEGGLARSVDPDAFRLTLITEHPEIAFAAVTISGTTAYIQIAERTPPPAKRDISLPINLVASRSGIIRKTIVIRGTAAVKAGQYVKEGELLVSGITALKNSAFRIVRAEGKIYGETCHAPEFTVPTQADVKVFTGREMTVSSLDILGSQIPLYLNGTCSFEDYDVMRFRDEAFLFDIIELPFGIMNRVFLEYEIKREWISPQRAQDIAYDLLAAYIKNKLTGAEIISKETEITCSDTDGSVTLRASINCIEDIAVEKEFTIGQ